MRNNASSYVQLHEIHSDLAYLAALTVHGLKPVSRWEDALPDDIDKRFDELGLAHRKISRKVATGQPIIETVFSKSPALLELYHSLFSKTQIDKSPHTQRAEGYLFGFPPCCIAQYIEQPYTPNHLPQEDQAVLFHWACPDCRVTPHLLPHYREIQTQLAHITSP